MDHGGRPHSQQHCSVHLKCATRVCLECSHYQLKWRLCDVVDKEITGCNFSTYFSFIDKLIHFDLSGDSGSIPGLGRSPREGNSNPLQYSCLENPMDRGAWRATVHEGHKRVGYDLATKQ